MTIRAKVNNNLYYFFETMKKYSEVFKREVLRDYYTLSKDGAVNIDGVLVENVRDLCEVVEVSRFSLYKWRDEIDMTKDKGVTKSKKSTGKKNDAATKKGKILEQDGISFDDFTFDPVNDKKLIVRSEIRFYGFLASLFGIKGYDRMKLTQLKLKLGLRMIKDSGLVKTIGD